MPEPISSLLAAMITPAVLISGAGTLIMSTSTRVGRATDRVRALTSRFKQLVSEEGQHEPLAREEKRLIIRQLPRLSRRTRFLMRALQAFYTSVALLVLTSILLGLDGLFDVNTGSLPLLMALGGSVALAYGALLLSYEARFSAATTKEEMRFLEELGQHYAGLYAEELGGAEETNKPPPAAGAGGGSDTGKR